jgi:hypothetical protein
VGFCLRHIFAVAGTASQFPNRNRKNVVYLSTLCAIFLEIVCKNDKEA